MTDPVKIIVGEGSITEVNVPEYNLIQTGGGGGGSGSDGATFFPEVSEEGVISWTNDGGYDNPEPVNIKGPAGNDGNDGEDGADGVSPTVTFSTITGGHTMTVTDKDHPEGQSINIMDGTSGGGGTSDYDDLTDKPSINNVTLSGNKTAAELGLGTYSKPSSGIPQTDLASAVQNKLDKTVVVSDTQPTATENKLWVDTDAGTGSTYQVPTVAEMEAADAQVAAKIGSQIADSGWKNLTLTSAFTLYGTASVAQYRKIGKLVMLRGQIKPTSEIAASGTNTVMSSLPTGFRPSLDYVFICQGSSANRWALTVYANGNLGVGRYGAADLAAIPTNAWLVFNAMFFVG